MKFGETLKVHYPEARNTNQCPFCNKNPRDCGIGGVFKGDSFVRISMVCKSYVPQPMQIGEVRETAYEKDELSANGCPMCGNFAEKCRFKGNWMDKNHVEIIHPCLSEKISGSKSKGSHPCTCDLYTVLMVTGCKCGGI